jgi:hypothetical protein
MEEEVEKDWHEGHEPQLGYDHFEDEPENKFEHRNDTEHPYCTNWPVNRKKKNEKV